MGCSPQGCADDVRILNFAETGSVEVLQLLSSHTKLNSVDKGTDLAPFERNQKRPWCGVFWISPEELLTWLPVDVANWFASSLLNA